MNEKKSYKVQIFEEHYVLISDESESFVIQVADMVDIMMKEISYQLGIADVKKIAVLSALRTADELLTLKKIHQKEQEKIVSIQNYIDQELTI